MAPVVGETGGRIVHLLAPGLGPPLCVLACTLSVYALDKTNLSTLNVILFLLLFFGRSFSLQ